MKIAVCAPTFGRGPEWEHPTPIHEVAQLLGGMTAFTGGCSPHDRSRGLIQARAMQTDAEAFLWVDDDIRATREQCLQLAGSFESQQDAATMTGVYVCRHLAAVGRVAFNFNPLVTPGQDLDLRFGSAGRIHPVTSHGFGFCIVNRRCLEAIAAPECQYEGIPARAWFLPVVVEGEHLGEDRSFTYRVARAELPMYVDSRLCVEHAGWRVQ